MNGAAFKQGSNDLIRDNMPLVHEFKNRLIKKYRGMIETDEIVGYAFYGAAKAEKTYNPELGFAFSTYLKRCMDNAVKNGIRDYQRYDVRMGEMGYRNFFLLGNNQIVESLWQVTQDQEDLGDCHDDPKSRFEDSSIKKIELKEVLAVLNEKEFLVLYLNYYQDLKAKDVAQILGVCIATEIEIRKRALNKLRANLEVVNYPN